MSGWAPGWSARPEQERQEEKAQEEQTAREEAIDAWRAEHPEALARSDGMAGGITDEEIARRIWPEPLEVLGLEGSP